MVSIVPKPKNISWVQILIFVENEHCIGLCNTNNDIVSVTKKIITHFYFSFFFFPFRSNGAFNVEACKSFHSLDKSVAQFLIGCHSGLASGRE